MDKEINIDDIKTDNIFEYSIKTFDILIDIYNQLEEKKINKNEKNQVMENLENFKNEVHFSIFASEVDDDLLDEVAKEAIQTNHDQYSRYLIKFKEKLNDDNFTSKVLKSINDSETLLFLTYSLYDKCCNFKKSYDLIANK